MDLSAISEEKENEIYHYGFEQYRLYSSIAAQSFDRCDRFHRFYIAINTCFLASIFLFSFKTYHLLLLSCFALLNCISWYHTILSQIRLNIIRLKVIRKMEEYLPFKPFTEEVEFLLKKEKTYRLSSPSRVEKLSPMIILLLYAILIAYLLLWH